ncbi:unnamed protein product [Adineta ricciae]|nr:unnamed protein product [Adineta ricciae]
MVGGSYCPLSPRDPRNRLQHLLQQNQSDCILVDSTTENKFEENNITLLNTRGMIGKQEIADENHLDQLSSIESKSDTIAFVIFTSGSTGTSKAVQITHHNLWNCMFSFESLGIITKYENVIQMAQCIFDVM